ncbi:MAG: hypothetical protein Q7S07_00780, partial [Candidatus Omnitrophota bacterium]|nr:hypothetical protein [Candidatus Omnitrophota bacterium]
WYQSYDGPNIVTNAAEQELHPAVRDIMEYQVPLGLREGPGVVNFSDSVRKQIWDIVNLAHDNRVEIFIPQDVGLTENMKEALKDIEKREGGKVVREYANEIQLARLLGKKAEPGVKRVVITEGRSSALVRGLAEKHSSVFRNIRVINMAFPEGYENLPTGAKTFYQARMVMTGFLGGLYDKNEPTSIVGIILKSMLEGCVDVGDEGMDGFLNRMAESEDEANSDDKVKDRILYCLGKTVSLLNKIRADMEQVRLMMIEFMTKL